jgi:hypothetical protein
LKCFSKFTKIFRDPQAVFEGDEFGIGSYFIERQVSVQNHVGKFQEIHPEPVKEFKSYLHGFKRRYTGEYRLLLFMLFLDPSINLLHLGIFAGDSDLFSKQKSAGVRDFLVII